MAMAPQTREQNTRGTTSICISRENVIGMHERIKERLSKFEYQVLELYLKGYDYTQIAEKLGKQPKAIDNALQRIRSKVREVCS